MPTGQDHDVDSTGLQEQFLVKAEALANESLQAVAPRGALADPGGNGQAEARMVQLTGPEQDAKGAIL